MKSYWILFSAAILFSFYIPTVDGLFDSLSLQDFIDNFVNAAKFKLEGMLSLNDSTVNRIWSFFKSRYGRVYKSLEEEKQRFQIFRDHLKYVLESNLQKLRTFQLELNEYADWTLEEFDSFKKGLVVSTSLRRRTFHENFNNEESVRRSLQKLYQEHLYQRRIKRSMTYRRYHPSLNDKRGFMNWILDLLNSSTSSSSSSSQSTQSFDWRSKNVVGSVKNQLKCGCCYAFATASVLESIYAIKTKSKTVTEFSPQQITDCSSNGNNGCNGGNFAPTIRYVLGQGNQIATLDSYPYVGQKQTCKTSQIKKVNLGQIEYNAINQGDEAAMQGALVKYGPLFIGLDADSKLFMFYKSGVLSIDNCPNRRQDMDHAMVVVGYGYDSTMKAPYWIIKNSWGEKWGENGYLRLIKDHGNMCGIASMTYYATLT